MKNRQNEQRLLPLLLHSRSASNSCLLIIIKLAITTLANCEGGFICFDFKDKRIQLTCYSIKSSGNSSGSGHLRNWVIEVSKDGNEWKEVDRHTNDSTLNGRNIIGTFKVNEKQTDFYHFIRLRQIGYSWRGDYFIYFPQIEFFGKLERISK